jgi:ribonuclease D
LRAWSRPSSSASRNGRPPISTTPPAAPVAWITTAPDLDALAPKLTALDEIALDTEGDSLHHYPERLALIQIAERGGVTWFVDPLALTDLSPLAPLFAKPRPLLVLHAGDNDLGHLKRLYRFTFGTVFDTSIAARFLGGRSLGLDVLIRDYLGLELPPSRQKDDWSARPLSPAQEQYAAADVQHLFALKDRLREELARVGRLEWVEEECAALAAEPPVDRIVDPDAYLWLKGARELPPEGLAILRELHELREHLALTADRPPFKIFSEATLVALAKAAPADAGGLAGIVGCTPRVIARWGDAMLGAIAQGRSAPPASPAASRPRGRSLSSAARRRIDALRGWRTEAAPRLGLDPGVLLPNRLIRVIAEAGPHDLAELARVDGVRRWRVDILGAELVRAVVG